MSKLPPIPPEQRHFGKEHADIESRKTPKDGKGSPDRRGEQANIKQNLTPQRSVQDR
jgi:hypothetical protein